MNTHTPDSHYDWTKKWGAGHPPPGDDFLRYFAAVARGEIKPSGPSSLKNNLIVTEILDVARRSAATGQTVRLT